MGTAFRLGMATAFVEDPAEALGAAPVTVTSGSAAELSRASSLGLGANELLDRASAGGPARVSNPLIAKA